MSIGFGVIIFRLVRKTSKPPIMWKKKIITERERERENTGKQAGRGKGRKRNRTILFLFPAADLLQSILLHFIIRL